MTVYDTVIFRDRECLVEQVFDVDSEPYCAIRPLDHTGPYSGECCGTYFVAQSATHPTQGDDAQ